MVGFEGTGPGGAGIGSLEGTTRVKLLDHMPTAPITPMLFEKFPVTGVSMRQMQPSNVIGNIIACATAGYRTVNPNTNVTVRVSVMVRTYVMRRGSMSGITNSKPAIWRDAYKEYLKVDPSDKDVVASFEEVFVEINKPGALVDEHTPFGQPYGFSGAGGGLNLGHIHSHNLQNASVTKLDLAHLPWEGRAMGQFLYSLAIMPYDEALTTKEGLSVMTNRMLRVAKKAQRKNAMERLLGKKDVADAILFLGDQKSLSNGVPTHLAEMLLKGLRGKIRIDPRDYETLGLSFGTATRKRFAYSTKEAISIGLLAKCGNYKNSPRYMTTYKGFKLLEHWAKRPDFARYFEAYKRRNDETRLAIEALQGTKK